MKKKALLRRGLVLFMSAALLFTQPAIALAADTVPAQESGEEVILNEETPSSEGEDVSEELSETESEEESKTSEEESETTEEGTEESETSKEGTEEESETTEEGTEEESETSEEGTEEESETTEEETEEESELTEEEVFALFPGLDAGIALTDEAYESKDQLSAHSDEWDEMREGVDYVEGQLLYRAETEELANEYAKAYNATVIDYFCPYAVAELNADDAYDKATVMDALEASLLFTDTLPAVWPNTINQLEDLGDEAEIEKSYTYVDPYADPYKTGSSDTRQWQHNAVASQIAWANGYAGQGVSVGVIDTGFTNHIELNPNRIDIGLGVDDDQGHGTHVAGTIAERGGGTGGCGIAPEVTIYTVKANSGSGIYTSYAIKGLQELAKRGVNVVNISSGSYYYNKLYAEAIKTAYESGMAIFASAGNETSSGYHYPSDFKEAISIGALNEALGRADFSNHSSRVRYYAPGVDILSLKNDGSSYVTMSGTSMASPVAAGEAAVILSSGLVQGTGKTRVDNLLKIMDKGCVKLSGSDMGKGMVSLPKALGLSDTAVAPKAPVFSHKSGTSFTAFTQKITITAEAGCTIYYSIDGKPVTYKNGVLSSNASKYTGAITITNTSKRTIYALCIKDSNKLASKCVSATYTMKTPVSSITLFTNNGLNTLLLGGSLKLNANVYPAGAANKKVTWTITPANQGVKIDSSGKVSATSTAKAGTYTVKATSVSNPEVTRTYRVAVYPKELGAASYTLKTKSYTMWKGETVAYPQVDVKYNDGSTASSVQTGLTWISSNSSIVYVDTTNKRFQAKGAGKATLTGYDPMGSGKTVKVTITVNQPIEGIAVPSTTAYLQTGKNITLSPTILPANAKKQTLSYEISPANQGVTISSSGKITATKTAKTGTYKATVSVTQTYTAGNENVFKQVVTVYVNSMTETPKLTISDTKVDLFKGKNLSSTALTKTINVTTNCKWTYEVSPANIISVAKTTTSLVVTARGTTTGTAKITVKTTDGTNLKKTITVNIHNAPSEIRVSCPTGRVELIAYGKTLKLSTVLGTENGPLDSYSKKITWSSSNPKVLPVNSSGVVTSKAYNAETATITAKTADGKQISILVAATDVIKQVNLRLSKYGVDDYGSFYWQPYITIQHYSGKYCNVFDVQSSDEKNCPAHMGYVSSKKSVIIDPQKYGTYTIKIKAMDGSGFSASLKIQYYYDGKSDRIRVFY